MVAFDNPDLLFAFGEASHLLFQKFCPHLPFYQAAFLYLFLTRVLSGVKLVIKTQQLTVYKMEMKSIHCSHKDSLC